MIFINTQGKKVDHGVKFFESESYMAKNVEDTRRGWGYYEPVVLEQYEEDDQYALEQLFYQHVHNHDLTFNFSDDHRVWSNGNTSLSRCKGIANKLPRAKAVEIWNSVVDEKMAEDYRKDFYWS